MLCSLSSGALAKPLEWSHSKSRKEGIKIWQATWRDLPQAQIQAWIERIPWHIQQIIRLNGGNEYREGRDITGQMISNIYLVLDQVLNQV